MGTSAADRLLERLRARFAGRLPEKLGPGKGYVLTQGLGTWCGRRACWRAARALEREWATELGARGIGVQLEQVDTRPFCCCFGNRMFVEYSLGPASAFAPACP